MLPPAANFLALPSKQLQSCILGQVQTDHSGEVIIMCLSSFSDM